MSNSISSADMRRIEWNARFLGLTEVQMMESAGKAVADYIVSNFRPCTVAVYCGLGGNGGDGLVAARHLASRGFKVKVVLVGHPDRFSHEASRSNWILLNRLGSVEVFVANDGSSIPEVEAEVYLDALLGVGVKGEVRPPILQAVEALNRMKGVKLSIDIPSGLDADTGRVLGAAVKADVTLTIHRVKRGLEANPGYTGRIVVLNIGIPPEAEIYVGPGDLKLTLRPRRVKSHKGDYGRVLVVGGSRTFTGAPTLTALASIAVGVDLAVVASPEAAGYSIASYTPDLIVVKLPGNHLKKDHLEVVGNWLERCDSLAVGPGLGLLEETRETVKLILDRALTLSKPVVVDADGIKALSNVDIRFGGNAVLTPHLGEFRILTGESIPESIAGKSELVMKWARRLEAVILLKGPIDIISDGSQLRYNFTGNPAMTVGGTGDVLTGLVAGFLAQGFNPFLSAVSAAFLNGAAGDLAVECKPYIKASDLLNWIPKVLSYVSKGDVETLASRILSSKDFRRIMSEVEGYRSGSSTQ